MEVWVIIIIALSAVVVILIVALSLAWLANARFQVQIQEVKESFNAISKQIQKSPAGGKKLPDGDVFQKAISALRDESIKIVNQSAEFARAQTTRQTLELKKELDAKKLAEMKIARGEIEKYKKLKQSEIDQKAAEVIRKAVESVLGQTIDISTHEKLILDACQKAKAEKFFKD